jgi:type I restriction enzyme, S subunit
MALWSEVPFESIYLEPSKNGINRPRNTRGSGYKMINMGELFAYGRINNPEMELVSLDEDEKKKYGVLEGDLLFARQSLVKEGAGKCSIVNSVSEPTCFEGHLIRVRLDQAKADPLFYYYYFSSYEGKGKVQSLVMQVAAAGIRGSELAKLSIPYPPLPNQRKIADVLSAYDDLIEVNTRRIRILEQMAQSVYREWFGKVDERSLPEGWKICKLGDIASEVRRNVQPNQINPATPYFGLEHLPRKSIALSEWGKAGDVQSTKLAFKKGEILFGKIRPYFHKVGVAPLDGVSSTDAIVIVPDQPDYFGLTLSCVSSEDFVNYATQTSQGTKMPRANWDVLVNYQILIPPKDILKKHSDFIQDIVGMIQILIFANRNLRRTRDLLLPRLVSGEVIVEGLEDRK